MRYFEKSRLFYLFCLFFIGSYMIGSHALADLLIVTNSENPVDQLTLKEVRKIFLGRMGMFPGTDQEPRPLDFPQDSPHYEHFYESVIGMPPAKIKRYRAYYLFSGKGKIPAEMPNMASVLKELKQNPDAIAYLPSAFKNDHLKILLRIKQPDAVKVKSDAQGKIEPEKNSSKK